MKIFAAFCALVVAAFAWAEWKGIDPFPESTRVLIPTSVRGQSGSYHTYRHFGGSGFRGGK